MPTFEGIFFIERGNENVFMHDADLFEKGKYLCRFYNVKFKTDKKITKKYLLDLINLSFESASKDISKGHFKYSGNPDRLVAIEHKGKIYAHKYVIAISDGYNFFWVNDFFEDKQ